MNSMHLKWLIFKWSFNNNY